MRVIVNWSVWASLDSFRRYVYGPEHRAAMRQRARWFKPPTGPTLALWWVPAGERPSGTEGHRRLELLRRYGPTPDSFTIQEPYPSGEATAGPPPSYRSDPDPLPERTSGAGPLDGTLQTGEGPQQCRDGADDPHPLVLGRGAAAFGVLSN
jgi:hypothetical protein